MPEFDMNEEVFNELMEYLEDPDEGELSIPATAKQWRRTQTRLFKILWTQASDAKQAQKEAADKIDAFGSKMDAFLDQMTSSPPLVLWMRNHLGRTFTIGISILLLFVALWFGLAALDSALDISNLDASIAFGVLGLLSGGISLLFKAT